MQTKIPKNNYVQGLLLYEDLRSKHEQQEKLIAALTKKENELQILKLISQENMSRARTLLILRS